MGLALRNVIHRMPKRLRVYRQSRMDQRMKGAAIAGAGWAYRPAPSMPERLRIAVASTLEAEAWHLRQIEERCDAYAAGWYD